MCRCYPPPQPHQYQIQLEIYHVYIPGPAHQHAGRCLKPCWCADVLMVSAIGTPLQKIYWCGTARHHLNITKWKYKLKSTMCTCLHWHIDMQAGGNTLYHADAPMVIAIGTPLKVMCRCASVTHHRNPTNTKIQLEIYHVYIPGPAHWHPGKCSYHADALMVSPIQIYHVYMRPPAHQHPRRCS